MKCNTVSICEQNTLQKTLLEATENLLSYIATFKTWCHSLTRNEPTTVTTANYPINQSSHSGFVLKEGQTPTFLAFHTFLCISCCWFQLAGWIIRFHDERYWKIWWNLFSSQLPVMFIRKLLDKFRYISFLYISIFYLGSSILALKFALAMLSEGPLMTKNLWKNRTFRLAYTACQVVSDSAFNVGHIYFAQIRREMP